MMKYDTKVVTIMTDLQMNYKYSDNELMKLF